MTAIGATTFVEPARAQTPPGPLPSGVRQPSREQLDPERQAPAPQTRSRDLFSAPAALPCPLAGSKVTFRLESVEIAGATVSPGRLTPAYQDLIGSIVPVSVICQIRDRLALALFRRGLLARVEAPAQTISGGRLKLVVVEARIVSVRVRGDIGPAQDKVEAYLDKLRGLAPFDLRTAQRYLLLANDVPGVRISAALRPSSEGRGAIDLDVQVSRRAYDAVGAVQNSGSDALGPWSALARVDLNSFTRFGERTTLIAYRSLPQDEQWIVQVIEEARFGTSGLLGRVALAYGQSHPGDVLKPLSLQGDSLIFTPEIQYPIVKLKRATLNAGAGFDLVEQKTKFPGGGLLANDKLRVAWASLAGEYQQPLFADRAFASGKANLQLRKGLSGLGASKTGDADLSRIEGRPDAWVVRLESDNQIANRLGVLGLRLQAQYAGKPLLSYEELAVGDLSIGRGYEPAVLSGERVVAGELKLSPQELRFGDNWGVTPFAYCDASRVENLDPGSRSRTLRSAGVGVDVRSPYAVRAHLAWAHPFDRPFPNQPKKPSNRIIVQLVMVR
ncbi:ShlB/FhaC/HecB family hemolysin secretion/activation protein [Phenylobacterium sp. LjRoot225]|uniref:ShlB/FhaC/HecB family hemolysin secretion/activation protein n=1 Tax=Phenylobacterium sp. LjRoot225 TaxID=3342285 RepID=UPI003ECC529B